MKELLNTLSYKKVGKKFRLNNIVSKNENLTNIEDQQEATAAVVKIRPTNFGINEKKNIHIADESRESELGYVNILFSSYM